MLEVVLGYLTRAADSFDINVRDVDGWTPLMWACKSWNPDRALFLIDKYKADISVRSTDGEWSPMKLARFYNWHDDVVERLVPEIGAQGREEDRVTQDRQTMPGKSTWPSCSGCSKVWDAKPVTNLSILSNILLTYNPAARTE